MQDIFKIWTPNGTFAMDDLTGEQLLAMEKAANFKGVSGCRADVIVAATDGRLYIIDSTGESHDVPHALFAAVKNEKRYMLTVHDTRKVDCIIHTEAVESLQDAKDRAWNLQQKHMHDIVQYEEIKP